MNFGLHSRVALITGSSRGLGRAIAESLAREGANIIVNGRNSFSVIEAARDLANKHNVKTFGLIADAADTERIKDWFDNVLPQIGRLEILVNNVGNIEKAGGFFDLTDEDWMRSFDLSFMSVVRFSRAAHPWLKKSGYGRIINIGSLAAVQPNLNVAYWHYAAAKNAVNAVSKMMANEFGKDHITVNTICPATLMGGGWHENVKRRAEREGIPVEEAETRMIHDKKMDSPLGRVGEVEDVANFVTYLASDQARFITGGIHYVDGGIRKAVQ